MFEPNVAGDHLTAFWSGASSLLATSSFRALKCFIALNFPNAKFLRNCEILGFAEIGS